MKRSVMLMRQKMTPGIAEKALQKAFFSALKMRFFSVWWMTSKSCCCIDEGSWEPFELIQIPLFTIGWRGGPSFHDM